MATLEKLEGSLVKLTIEIPADTFEAAVQQAYINTAKNYNVPGFRKGKAPRKVIENTYGSVVFFSDAFDIAYLEAYSAAIVEHGIQPLSRPEISIEDMGEVEGNAVVFTVTVPVRPDVTLGQYKGIEVVKREYNVTDEMVQTELASEQEKVARYVDVERAIESGDLVNLDYSGSVDGVKFDGGTAEDQQLSIGSGMFIPGFEEQLVGMSVGDEGDITTTFPEEYHAPDLAGKEAVFHVKINAIQVKELPELDDEFAKDVSEFDTLDALRDAKRKALEESFAESSKNEMENDAMGKIVEQAEVEIPSVLVDNQLEYMIQDMTYRLGMQGISIESYCEYTGTTPEAMRETMRPDAERRIKGQLVLEAVAAKEEIKASEEEVDAKVGEYAARLTRTVEEIKQEMSAEDRMYFEDQVVFEKTIAAIMESVVLVDPPVVEEAAEEEKSEEKPKPKRKPAAKKKVTEPEAE